MHQFMYVKPKDITEAVRILAENGEKVRVLAGGTDLIVRMVDKIWKPEVVIDIKGLTGLSGIREIDNYGVAIGAATPLNEIIGHPLIQQHFAVLAEGAHEIGSCQIRNRATLGGNLCNASPLADTAPALLVLDAVAVVQGEEERLIPMTEFFAGPGKTILARGELLKEIRIPYLPTESKGIYYKHARTKAVDLASVGVAVLALKPGEIRIALGAVAPTPVRAKKAEAFLSGKEITTGVIKEAVALVQEEVSPITDIRATEEYRREIIAVLVRRGLYEIQKFLRGE
ncbi:MAG: hypothetical protein JG781_832 [Peptococcaceae bacterium]|jgi:carbon-monoxide dehydrogenase medium subunit|nr:hypothetical protein [Peptococcaceae bacterium]